MKKIIIDKLSSDTTIPSTSTWTTIGNLSFVAPRDGYYDIIANLYSDVYSTIISQTVDQRHRWHINGQMTYMGATFLGQNLYYDSSFNACSYVNKTRLQLKKGDLVEYKGYTNDASQTVWADASKVHYIYRGKKNNAFYKMFSAVVPGTTDTEIPDSKFTIQKDAWYKLFLKTPLKYQPNSYVDGISSGIYNETTGEKYKYSSKYYINATSSSHPANQYILYDTYIEFYKYLKKGMVLKGVCSQNTASAISKVDVLTTRPGFIGYEQLLEKPEYKYVNIGTKAITTSEPTLAEVTIDKDGDYEMFASLRSLITTDLTYDTFQTIFRIYVNDLQVEISKVKVDSVGLDYVFYIPSQTYGIKKLKKGDIVKLTGDLNTSFTAGVSAATEPVSHYNYFLVSRMGE